MLLGVALVCFASLLLQVVLTRIFSTTMFYHFTFVAIALALFGVGSAGVFVYVRRDHLTAPTVRRDLGRHARWFGLGTLLALAYVLANPIESITDAIGFVTSEQFTRRTFLQFVLLNAVVALPFFHAGVVVALAVTHYRAAIERVYFYDLIGAGLAALAAGLLLGLLGGPTLVLLVAALAMAGAWLLDGSRTRGPIALGATGALVLFNLWWPLFAVTSVKAVKAERVVFEKWNTFSRVTVEKMQDGSHDIRIDAGARTRIASADEIASRDWKKDIAALVHHTFDPGHAVLIIGSGGGADIVNALAAGAGSVLGVEVNPIIANDIMRGRFVKESGGLYRHPRVEIAVDDARSYIRRSTGRYDVIQATLVDTWAATAAGAFALSENTLYTVEAFRDYYQHLSDDGVLTMTRWDVGATPEGARLVVLAAGALESMGIPPGETRRHIIFVRERYLGTLLVKRTPFRDDEIDRIQAAADTYGWKMSVSPRSEGAHFYERLIDAGAWSRYVRHQPHDLTPPTDDRPFFFYFLKGEDLWKLDKHIADAATANPAVWILLTMAICVVALTGGFIVLPLWLFRRDDLARAGPGGVLRTAAGLGFFALIGLAFITVEIALLQKLALFLGHPSYALVVVLFSILIATALGARMSQWRGWRGHAAVIGGITVAVLCFVYATVLGPLLGSWVAWPITARAPVASLLVALCGVPMGLLLPSGIAILSRRDPHLVPWAWGINGATSVVGTVAATVIAIHAGFGTTLRVGGILYVLAAAAFLYLARLSSRGAPSSTKDNETELRQ